MTWYTKIANSRPPDVTIGGKTRPYMLRWHVIPRNRLLNIYLHRFLRSDDDRALHDHPWISCSYLLHGTYTEVTTAGERIAQQGTIHFRTAKTAHRIILHNGPCWSLFITGPKIREWGFHCPNGWRHWKVFTSPADSGEIGRGCD